jgi:hypothetical protein
MFHRSGISRSSATFALVTLFAATPAAVFAQAKQQGKPADNTSINAVKAALEKYKDPLVAVRDGYLSTIGCVDFPGGGAMDHSAMEYKPGAMGVHFINMGLIGPKLDSTKPQVLLYEPVGDKLVLTAAEWFVPTEVSKTPPSILGHQLQGPMEGHEPVMPTGLHHWDLHVWLWKDNPNGMFTATNPMVKCPKTGYGYSFAEKAPKIVKP